VEELERFINLKLTFRDKLDGPGMLVVKVCLKMWIEELMTESEKKELVKGKKRACLVVAKVLERIAESMDE
jgi:hypothetical protein